MLPKGYHSVSKWLNLQFLILPGNIYFKVAVNAYDVAKKKVVLVKYVWPAKEGF